MRRIRFNKLNSWKNKVFIAQTLICIALGYLEIPGGSEQNDILLRVFGWIGIVFFFLIKILGKYYVEWNGSRMTIKINSFTGSSFKLKDVKYTDFENEILTVMKENGEKIEFDLSEIEKADINRLNEIITKNTVVGGSYS